MAHTCPGGACTEDVPRNKLMCKGCWGKVPEPLQAAVYRAWDRGKGRGSAAHRAAIQAAIRSVNGDDRSPQQVADD
jgi:hypothetical protein